MCGLAFDLILHILVMNISKKFSATISLPLFFGYVCKSDRCDVMLSLS